MIADGLAIQIHLWVLTALVVLLVAANLYFNLIKGKKTSHLEYMKYLWEVERFEELHEYSAKHLKHRPNNDDALYFYAQASLHLKKFEAAAESAEKLAKSSPLWREEALELIKMIDDAASGS